MIISNQNPSLLLSIVIPAYNEETRLPQSLAAIVDFLKVQDFESEVLVVDDGSNDRTPEIVKEFSAKYPFIQLLQPGRGGKGHAVKAGML